MKNKIQSCLAATLLLFSATLSPVYADSAVSERIFFIQQDGRHAMVYTTSRSDYSDYSLWFNEKSGYGPEDYLKNFLYLFPNTGTWASEAKDGSMVLKLPQGDFASLRWVDLADKGRLNVDSDNVYDYQSWDSAADATTAEGHLGLWNSPGDFEQIAWSFVFPENLEPVTYSVNHEGKWVQRHNTITYYGNNVNNLVFSVRYRPASGDAYQDIKSLEGEGVEVEQQPTGIKMTLAETLLFPSGVATISAAGKALLDKLADSLKLQHSLHVVVAGHTDNISISKSLTKRFATNWELSSARAINIIHYLVSRGVAEPRFEAQAFSFMRPIVSNDSEAGRLKNRRIEIMLTEVDKGI